MKTILVPIDSKKEGDLVAEKAIQIASAFDSTVHLVHVTSVKDKGKEADREVENVSPEDVSAFEKEMEIMSRFKAKFTNAGLNCEVHLLRGAPARQVLNISRQIGAELIVLGYIEHSTWYKTFIGSVSNEVLRESPVPVLLIPAKKS